jgi:hypothetical protein
MVVFTSGFLIFVEGDETGEWFSALQWQQEKFMEVMKFGTMKSMCMPNPITLTEPFTNGDFQYQFKIINDWKPCYLINMTTRKEREIKYIKLCLSNTDVPSEKVSDNTISQIKI